MCVHIVQTPFGKSAACSRTGKRVLPCPPILRAPLLFSVRVKRKDDQIIAHVPGDIQPLAGNDRRRPPYTQTIDLPQQLRPAPRPAPPQAPLIPNTIPPPPPPNPRPAAPAPAGPNPPPAKQPTHHRQRRRGQS